MKIAQKIIQMIEESVNDLEGIGLFLCNGWEHGTRDDAADHLKNEFKMSGDKVNKLLNAWEKLDGKKRHHMGDSTDKMTKWLDKILSA